MRFASLRHSGDSQESDLLVIESVIPTATIPKIRHPTMPRANQPFLSMVVVGLLTGAISKVSIAKEMESLDFNDHQSTE